MTDDKKYNGWSNYETWAVKLWLGIIRGQLDRDCRETLRKSEAIMEAPDTGIEAGNTVDNPPLAAVQWASSYLWISLIWRCSTPNTTCLK